MNNNFNLFLILTILLISSCKKTGGVNPNNANNNNIDSGYYVVKFKNKFNVEVIDTNYTFRYGGFSMPFEKNSNSGYQSPLYGELVINTNPLLSIQNYSLPSNSINLQNPGQYYLRFYDNVSPNPSIDYIAISGIFSIIDVNTKTIQLYKNGPSEEFIVVNAKWSGTWTNKMIIVTCYQIKDILPTCFCVDNDVFST